MRPSVNRIHVRYVRNILLAALMAASIVGKANAQTRRLRIVAYNIEADIGVTNKQSTFTNIATSANAGPPLPGLIAPATNGNDIQLGGTLAGIGEESVGGVAQPIDILALEETTSNTKTVTPIVNGLNTFYGIAGLYSSSPYQGTESGGDTGDGNGPNAVVFNTSTVQLIESVPVDPYGGTAKLGGYTSGDSGEYREVMRYEFAPAGVAANASNVFYIYVSHYKSGSASTTNNAESRAGEATIVRTNMMSLPAGTRILHVGDFNTGETSEAMYGILIAPGTNQLIDPLNPSGSLTINFDSTSMPVYLTDSATSLTYRDDYEIMTTNIYYGVSGGLEYVPGTYHAFGNNGSASSAGSSGNTALNGHLVTNGPVFISAAQLDVDLTGASDHLPIVADYTITLPPPVITGVNLSGNDLVLTASNGITNAVYTVLATTDVSQPLSNWTAVATNTASGGNFSITASNAFDPSAPAQFFILQTP